MSNALIAFANVADMGTLSGGSWTSTLPLTNLKNRTLGKVARSSDALLASTKVIFDAGSALPIRTVGAINHNLSLTGKYRIRISNDNTFATVLADSGWLDAWPSVYQSIDLPWASDNFWGGKYSDIERQGYTWNCIYTATATWVARYIQIEFNDTSNSAGYVQFGRLFAGDAWQMQVNMLTGASIGWQSNTEIQEALSGAEYFAEKRPYRVARFTTGYMSVDEGMAKPFEIKRRMGISGEVIFVWNPEDTLHALRRQFYGRLRELSAIEYPQVNLTSTPWEVKELV